jgi:signal transduction histidine kinase
MAVSKPNILIRFLNTGVRSSLAFKEQRKTFFSNILALVVGLFCSMYFLVNYFYVGNNYGAWLVLPLCFVTILIPLLNRFGLTRLSGIIIGFLPLVVCVLIPPFSKYLSIRAGGDHDAYNVLHFMYGKIAALACAVVPYLVLDMRKKANRIALPIAIVMMISLFDPIHRWLGVGVDSYWDAHDKYLTYTNFVIYTTLLVVLISMHLKTSLNISYEDRIMDMLNELSRKSEKLRDEIDERSRSEVELARANAEALAAVKSRTAFFAQINHEIRTPLHGISSMSDLLENNPNPADNATLVRGLRVSVKQLMRLLNNVLDLHRIESEKFQLDSRPFRVSELAKTIRDSYEYLTLEKKQTLSIIENNPNDPVLLGDDLRIAQVLNNFIVNSIKHSIGSEIRLKVEVKEPANSRAEVRFEVTNEGAPIPSEMLEAIFDEHTQVGGSQKSGSGLGLYISKRILEAMGSRPFAANRPEGGVVFWFEIELPKS